MRVIFKTLAALVMACLCLGAAAQNNVDAVNGSSTANSAGKVDLMEGDVRVFDKLNAPRTVHVGDRVFEGDSIVTGSDGEIHMTMEDSGFIAVRPNTKMRIAQYRANGDDQDKGVISLLVGSFRSITGWIGKYQPKSYVIRTPTATIGIRGTDHEPKVIPEGSAEGESGTYDKVNTGGSFIRTPQGSVDIAENHAAFAPRAARGMFSRPRILDSVPNFYRPTRNEHLIEGKHEQIQRNIQNRREERRQQIGNGNRPSQHAAGTRMERQSAARREARPATKNEYRQRSAPRKSVESNGEKEKRRR